MHIAKSTSPLLYSPITHWLTTLVLIDILSSQKGTLKHQEFPTLQHVTSTSQNQGMSNLKDNSQHIEEQQSALHWNPNIHIAKIYGFTRLLQNQDHINKIQVLYPRSGNRGASHMISTNSRRSSGDGESKYKYLRKMHDGADEQTMAEMSRRWRRW